MSTTNTTTLPKPHVMVDLETMGKGPKAAICAIGAVLFYIDDTTNTGYIKDSFYRVVSLESSVENGGQIDPDTVVWWMRQNDKARAIFGKDAAQYHINSALIEFSKFCDGHFGRPEVWGNGATFDNVILRSAFENSHLTAPWRYVEDRCYRTLKSRNPHVPSVRQGTHHNALGDAMSQAVHLIHILTGKLPEGYAA